MRISDWSSDVCSSDLDLPCAAARFLDHAKPKLAVIMETELWPNHIHQCARRGIPVALANARLSERSARGYARFARLTAPMLAELSLIAVQTTAEAERFRRLGARVERSEEHTSELQSLLRISYAVCC